MTEEKKSATPNEEKKETVPASPEVAPAVPAVAAVQTELEASPVVAAQLEVSKIINGVLTFHRIDTNYENATYIRESIKKLDEIARDFMAGDSGRHIGIIRGLVAGVLITPFRTEIDRLQAKLNKQELSK